MRLARQVDFRPTVRSCRYHPRAQQIVGRDSESHDLDFIFTRAQLLVGIPTHNIIGTLPRINSDTESSRLTSCRCCFHWHDCPTSANCNYCAAGKDARHQWKDCRQLHLLGFVYPDRPTIGCIVVFFRLASEVWIGKQVDFKDDLARCTSLLSLTS